MNLDQSCRNQEKLTNCNAKMYRCIKISLFLIVLMLPASNGLRNNPTTDGKQNNNNNEVQSIRGAPSPENNIAVINKHNPQKGRRQLFDFWNFLFACT